MKGQPEQDGMRSELVRLLEGMEIYRRWRIASVQSEKGDVTQEDLDQIVMPSEMFLDMFESAGIHERKQVLDEVRKCLAHIARDLSEASTSDDLLARDNVREFLNSFREETGVDFFVECGFLKTLVGKVVRRGNIASDEEYEDLKELEISLSSAAINEVDNAELSRLLRDYEAKAIGI